MNYQPMNDYLSRIEELERKLAQAQGGHQEVLDWHKQAVEEEQAAVARAIAAEKLVESLKKQLSQSESENRRNTERVEALGSLAKGACVPAAHNFLGATERVLEATESVQSALYELQSACEDAQQAYEEIPEAILHVVEWCPGFSSVDFDDFNTGDTCTAEALKEEAKDLLDRLS